MNKDAIIADINISLMRANWWTASTLNGQAELRHMSKWSSEKNEYIPLTKEELITEAMQTANRHIHHADDSRELLFEDTE